MASTGSITRARAALSALDVLASLDPTSPLGQTQRTALAQWPGWGPLAPAFDPEPTGTWEQISDELSERLDAQAYRDATECVDNSFFTPPAVVDAVWGLLRSAGFTGGRVLEPGCGSGRFMAGAPEDLAVEFTGVERDATSARIAQALHPMAEILHERFERAALTKGFDAVVGNVPFSTQNVHDPALPPMALHNYFVARSLSVLREGGYLVVVTSRFALDATRNLLREVREVADFVGAVRMPTGIFRSEGTDVVADVVVLRKNTTRSRTGWITHPAAEETGNEEITYSAFPLPSRSAYTGGWGSYSPRHREPSATTVNVYWQDHPEHIAGQMTPTGNLHNPLAVTTTDPHTRFTAALDALSAQVTQLPMFYAHDTTPALDATKAVDAEGRKEGSIHLIDGALAKVTDGHLTPMPRGSAELRALVELKTLALELLDAEADRHAPDHTMAGLRSQVRTAYEGYVGRWGPLNRGTLHEGKVDEDTGMPSLSWRRPTLGGFRSDPDYLSVMALEDFDQDTGQAGPGPILLRRVNAAPDPVTSAETPEAALLISMGESGSVDLGRIAGLLGLGSEEAAEASLGSLVYRDPQDGGRLVTARTYLSGNVRHKVAAARRALAADLRYRVNVEALEEVMPADLGPGDIRLYLGNPCVTTQDVTDFVTEVVGERPRVEHDPATASWDCTISGEGGANATTVWGNPRLNAVELVHYALNGKAPVVYDQVYGGKKVRNPEASMAAQEKTNALHERFTTWVWEDSERAERLCQIYNERFNSFVERKADGSHLRFPGMNEALIPHPWQRNIVDQIASSPATLCGHAVGAGKTLSMCLTAMTLRKFGLVRKPMIVVPNHLLEQIAREMQQAYPLGRFLIAAKEDLTKDRRRLFVARCATGDWDAVVITHQGFTSIPVSPGTERAWLVEQKDDYDQHLRTRTGGHFGAKQIARRLRSLETRLEALRGFVDPDQVTFEQLGVDLLLVDEAHMFKRLPVASRAEGFSMGASKRATDLLLKSRWLAGHRGDKPRLGLFTGTPWTNSLAETFVWQKFLQPEDLDTAGVADFDAWAAVFVRRETIVEVAPDGSGFRTTTRPTRMTNMVRLRTMFAQVADVLSADDIGLERPGKVVESIDVQRSPAQADYIASLIKRAERLRSHGQAGTNDNMLAICGDGRRVALDPQLVGVPGESPKMLRAAERVAQIHRHHASTTYGPSTTPGALQIVFCDQGTPSKAKGGQSYGRMRDLLIAQGVPAAGIRMIHEATDDKSRAALFAACRDGQVSVLLGSTEKLGMGTNIQTRLAAVHHLDAPWRPSDIDQREGRALRPKNLNPEVIIARYVTTRSFDAFTWGTLERKALGFAAMYDRRSAAIEVDDIGEVAPSYTQMKALASGSPLLMEQATLGATIARLRSVRAIDRQGLVAATKRIRANERTLTKLHIAREALTEYLDGERVEEDTAALATKFQHMITQARRWDGYGYRDFRWGGLEFSRRYSAEIEVRFGYRTMAYLGTDLRKGRAGKALQLAVAEVIALHDGLPGRLVGVGERIDSLEEQNRESQRVIDAYEFPRAAELAAAEAQLAAVERRIQVEADAAAQAPSAEDERRSQAA